MKTTTASCQQLIFHTGDKTVLFRLQTQTRPQILKKVKTINHSVRHLIPTTTAWDVTGKLGAVSVVNYIFCFHFSRLQKYETFTCTSFHNWPAQLFFVFRIQTAHLELERNFHPVQQHPAFKKRLQGLVQMKSETMLWKVCWPHTVNTWSIFSTSWVDIKREFGGKKTNFRRHLLDLFLSLTV